MCCFTLLDGRLSGVITRKQPNVLRQLLLVSRSLISGIHAAEMSKIVGRLRPKTQHVLKCGGMAIDELTSTHHVFQRVLKIGETVVQASFVNNRQ